MKNIKQRIIEEMTRRIAAKEQEIQESEDELVLLSAKLKIENKLLSMKDLKEYLREDFTYSAQALDSMFAQEQQKNTELKKDLEMLVYRKAVAESQFSSDRDFLNE